MVYTKEFLMSAFMSRYTGPTEEIVATTRKLADEFYDKVGKDKFRVYASLDAAAIKKFKLDSVQ